MKHAELLRVARLLERLFRATKGRLSLQALVVLCVGVVLYVAIIRPMAERSFGISLPELVELEGDQPSQKPRDDSSGIQNAEASDLLEPIGRNRYRSPAGIVYGPGSAHGHRFDHLMAHTRNEPDRVGSHGVFSPGDAETVVALLDEAYKLAESGSAEKTSFDEGRTTYTVDLGRKIGYIGGQSGARRGQPSASHMRLVLSSDRLITAYPVLP